MASHNRLSFPHGISVNDRIDPSLCSLAYTTADEVAALIAQLGPEALLAKVDIESAYMLIPVHPQDRPLQAMRWKGQLYIEPMLPFGLQSGPKIINAVADALKWHLHQLGIPLILHYLDHFIIVAHPHSSQYQESLATLDRVCRTLSVPITGHQRDGPTTRPVFLRIEIGSGAGSQQTSCSTCECSCMTGGAVVHVFPTNWSHWCASLITPAESYALGGRSCNARSTSCM